MAIRKLNHAVLWVRDAQVSKDFYTNIMGFEVLKDLGGAVFLAAPHSDSDHDLGLFSIGADAEPTRTGSGPGRGVVGLYHLAWEVDSLGELAELRDRLSAAGALVGMSNHGVTKSLYVHDPDGIEFEVLWQVPLALLEEADTQIRTEPLDLDAELARYGDDLVRADHA
ncbi:MAG: VOC family protein [Actinomycetota bacterium]|jgi:catechol-2,3-dioxygenase|nr:VOC family protein [Actinomycetota bacterium]